MKLLISVLIVAALCQDAATAADTNALEKVVNGHSVRMRVETSLETNQGVLMNGGIYVNAHAMLYATNYWPGYYSQPHEDPFPRVSESHDYFEVTSNSFLVIDLDGAQDRVCKSSVRLGLIERSSKTVISTVTNSTSTETFKPECGAKP